MARQRPTCSAVDIARTVFYLDLDPQVAPLLPAGAAVTSERLLRAAGLLKPAHVALYRRPWFRRLTDRVQRWVAPGHVLHIGLRKRFFDEETRAALSAGATQVLVLGAGFDTLCVRLAPEHPDVGLFELDRPSTHQAKLAAIEALGAGRPNLHLIGVDLSVTSLDQALGAAPGWRQDAVSVMVVEGVLMYLPEPAVSEMLEALRRCTRTGSRLLFTYLPVDEAGKPAFGKWGGALKTMARLIGEPFLWGIAPEALPGFLAPHGFRVDPDPDRCDLRRRFLGPAGLADWALGRFERIAVAERVEPDPRS